jgi:hypothetical protein
VINQSRPITKELIESLRLPNIWPVDLSNIPMPEMLNGHMLDCASHGEGPCTCGTEEELEAIAREEYFSSHCNTDSDEEEDEEALEEKAYQEDPKKTWDYWDYK